MKTIIRHLLRDKVSFAIFLLTIAAAITHFDMFLWILVLFVFRGIIWEGQYVDSLNKYVTKFEYRIKLGLPIDGEKTTRYKSVVELIFEIVFLIAIVASATYIIYMSILEK